MKNVLYISHDKMTFIVDKTLQLILYKFIIYM